MQWSSDGINFTDVGSNNDILQTFEFEPIIETGETFYRGTFALNNLGPNGSPMFSSKKFRLRIPVGTENYYSNVVGAICAATECSQYWPVGYNGPAYSADCGLAPGADFEINCDLCSCVLVPTWTTQPTNSGFNSSNGAQFSWGFIAPLYTGQQLSDPTYEYSDDGSTWNVFTPDYATEAPRTMSVGPYYNTITASGSFKVMTLIPTRRYRVRLIISTVNNFIVYVSDSAFAVCPAVECSQYWPVGYDGPRYNADCGLIPQPGISSTMNCDICSCVQTPVPTAS